MPHISKKELNKHQFTALFRQLVRSIHDLDTADRKNDFLWQFLTPTEKVMLSKRLAMIFLLEHGESTYEISEILNVSPSTISRIARRWDKGGYSEVLPKQKGRADRIADFLGWLHTVGGLMPPRIRIRKIIEGVSLFLTIYRKKLKLQKSLFSAD